MFKDGQIDVTAVYRAVRRRIKFFYVGLFFCLLAAVAYLHVVTHKYAVTLELTSTTSDSKVGQGAQMLSSIAGVNLSSLTGSDDFEVYVAALDSAAAAEQLMKRPDILHMMFYDKWDAESKAWKSPNPFVSGAVSVVTGALGIPYRPFTSPNTDDVTRFLQREVKITQDDKSGVVTLELDDKYPDQAGHILLAITGAVDTLMRKRALAQADSHIQFLRKELDTITVADYRQSLLDTISDQEKIKMMASGNAPYVAELLGSPQPTATPVVPSAPLILVMSFVFGTIVGLFVALLADARDWSFRIRLLDTSAFGRARQRTG